ncbi:Hypothetical predicted protein, partial [Paramuricea clavata]
AGNDDNKVQQRALLLHCAGSDVQVIFDVLPETGNAKEYEKAEEALTRHFVTQVNVPYERHMFRELAQNENETIDQFAVRLRRKAQQCDYGDQLESQIRDQIISRCRSSDLRRKFLENGRRVQSTKRQAKTKDLKKKHIKCTSRKTTKKLYAYGSTTPLIVTGTFTADVNVADRHETTEFTVIEGKGEPLLGRKTATELGVLKLQIPEQFVNSVTDRVARHKVLFQDIGKLKEYQMKLHIDPQVRPVAQSVRRTAFSLRGKIEEKLDKLLREDIIEKVDGPTPWVNPVVVVPKANGEVRLCVDMRCANTAIIRERLPIPTIDAILQDMQEGCVFSKLDLKWGYHQIELSEESRSITTFVTHKGLLRYKRLMFGISSAPEKYQQVIQQVLQDCSGTANISDDIIIYGFDQAEHDKRLEKLTFMGLLLSNRGIGPTEEKVRAVVEARESQNVTEVKSFLGLQESFRELKRRLVQAETLSYFNREAKTKIVCDASPVGLGAIVLQEHKGEDRVICYASRGLTEVERRYSQTEKDALAVVWSCEKFHIYLYGRQFELWTDHKPLELKEIEEASSCDEELMTTIVGVSVKLRPIVIELGYEGHQGILKMKQRLQLPGGPCRYVERRSNHSCKKTELNTGRQRAPLWPQANGMCPAELMFRRKLRTKLPELRENARLDEEMRDKDREEKEKMKGYADKRRNAKESNLSEGDKVLGKHHRKKHYRFYTLVEEQPLAEISGVTLYSQRNLLHINNENDVKYGYYQRKILMQDGAINEKIRTQTHRAIGRDLESDMIHTWLCNLECPEKHLRLCFLDFEKAFDHWMKASLGTYNVLATCFELAKGPCCGYRIRNRRTPDEMVVVVHHSAVMCWNLTTRSFLTDR